MRYSIDRDLKTNSLPIGDERIVSGRVLILPQRSYSLAANVQQILDSTNPNNLIDMGIDKGQQAILKSRIQSLEFLSAPLSGLTSNLTTKHQGTHIKPTFRALNSKQVAMQAAVDPAKDAFPDGFAKTLIGLVDAESAQTPYGSSIDFAPNAPCPMKPAMHGQLMFTKLNIIDRLGQAICGIDPIRFKRSDDYANYRSVFPCVGDVFA